jgi:hypothetical protein
MKKKYSIEYSINHSIKNSIIRKYCIRGTYYLGGIAIIVLIVLLSLPIHVRADFIDDPLVDPMSDNYARENERPPIPSGVDPNKYLKVGLIDNDKIQYATVSFIIVAQGSFTPYKLNESRNLSLELRDPENTIVYSTYLDLPRGISIVHIPYYLGAKSLQILEKGNVISNYSLAMYIPFCGNGICDANETMDRCKWDCSINSSCLRDGVCNKMCPTDPDCEELKKNASTIPNRRGNSTLKNKSSERNNSSRLIPSVSPTQTIPVQEYEGNSNSNWMYIGGIGIIILIVGITIIVMRRRSGKTESVGSWIENQLQKGTSIIKIRNDLLRAGYPESYVNREIQNALLRNT